MNLETYLRFAMALGFVLALLLGLAWTARRYGLGGLAMRPVGQRRRLAIVEVLALDPKRRLVIVRRDQTEHLIVLGPMGETVVERGIVPPEPFTLPAAREELP